VNAVYSHGFCVCIYVGIHFGAGDETFIFERSYTKRIVDRYTIVGFHSICEEIIDDDATEKCYVADWGVGLVPTFSLI